MTKAEIEFLRSAGFSVAEIMAMNPAQNAQTPAADPTPPPVQTAQTPSPDPTPAPAQTAPAPAEPATPAAAPAQTPAGGDPQSVILEKLDRLIAAVQAGNRSGASVQTPEKKSPEEIAGQLY